MTVKRIVSGRRVSGGCVKVRQRDLKAASTDRCHEGHRRPRAAAHHVDDDRVRPLRRPGAGHGEARLSASG